jgi:thiamine biosynthesis lipoprotein
MAVTSTFAETSGLFYGCLTEVMWTKLDVVIVHPEREKVMQCWDDIQHEVCRLDSLLNRFDPSSELYKLNKKAKKEPTKVENELWRILTDCRGYYEMTDGYFDVSLVNFADVLFNSKEQTLFFKDKNIELDLGGYAKGYALERIKLILSQYTVNCALINFGNSSILGVGKHPYGDCWPIGIDNPYCIGKNLGIIHLKDNSMSVSGNMPSHPKHIMNPHLKEYIEEKMLVAVQLNNSIDAEVLSTALMAAPPSYRSQIISHFKPEQLFLFDNLV